MQFRSFAQINAQGVCFAQIETSGNVNAPHMIAIPNGENRLGQRWTGTAWEAVAPTTAELAAQELAQIDRDTGMNRALREALLAIAAKVGADVAFLASKEAQAAAARTKLKG